MNYLKKKEVKKELNELRDNIAKGNLSFESAAKFKSCDQGSAEKGGDFGWVGRGQFVPEFEEMAYNTPINEISPVFESLVWELNPRMFNHIQWVIQLQRIILLT